MMYPMLNDGVELGIYETEDSGRIGYYAINPDGEEYELGEDIYKVLENADGTTSLKLSKKSVEKLKRIGLLRTSRFVRSGELLNRFILFPVGRNAKKYRRFCRGLNRIMLVSAVCIFVAGVGLKLAKDLETGYDFDYVLYCGSIVMSMIFHELGHLIAGLAYGYKITETGVLLLGIIPVGGYVAHEEGDYHIGRGKRIRFALAGICANLLLAGIFLLLSMYYDPLSYTFISIANLNVVIALFNLLPAEGLDGERALSELFEVSSFNNLMRMCLRKKKYRRKLFKSGLKGYACIGTFCFVILSEMLVRILPFVEIGYLIYSVICMI